jgi:uncharacterized LabA/DUF88 family protein
MNKERASIFIDGSNLYHNLKNLKVKISIEELIRLIESKREIIDIFYYTANLDQFNSQKYDDHRKFLDKIEKIPKLHVILCNLKKIKISKNKFIYQIKGDDINLAVDLLKGSYENLYDIAIIVSGDADFIPAINLIKSKNKKVINAYFPKSSSYLLRNICDGSIDLKKLIKKEVPI